MAKRKEGVDDAFIARRPQDVLQFPPRPGLRATDQEVSVPAIFDERRIRRDLQQLAQTPGLFGKYITVLKSRFTKASEVSVLDHWISYYNKGKQVIEARTGLVRAQHEHLQLEREFHIKDREKDVRFAELDVRLVELDANLAEAELRTLRARYAAHELKTSILQANSQPPLGQNSGAAGPLEQWYLEARQAILTDTTLLRDEQEELLGVLNAEYQARKGQRYL